MKLETSKTNAGSYRHRRPRRRPLVGPTGSCLLDSIVVQNQGVRWARRNRSTSTVKRVTFREFSKKYYVMYIMSSINAGKIAIFYEYDLFCARLRGTKSFILRAGVEKTNFSSSNSCYYAMFLCISKSRDSGFTFIVRDYGLGIIPFRVSFVRI